MDELRTDFKVKALIDTLQSLQKSQAKTVNVDIDQRCEAACLFACVQCGDICMQEQHPCLLNGHQVVTFQEYKKIVDKEKEKLQMKIIETKLQVSDLRRELDMTIDKTCERIANELDEKAAEAYSEIDQWKQKQKSLLDNARLARKQQVKLLESKLEVDIQKQEEKLNSKHFKMDIIRSGEKQMKGIQDDMKQIVRVDLPHYFSGEVNVKLAQLEVPITSNDILSMDFIFIASVNRELFIYGILCFRVDFQI